MDPIICGMHARLASSATAAHPLPTPTAVLSAKASNQKPAVPAGLKPLSSGLSNSNTFFPAMIGNISPLPYPICFGPSSTIIGYCSMRYSKRQHARCLAGQARDKNQHSLRAAYLRPATQSASEHVCVTCRELDIKLGSGVSCFSKRKPSKKFGATWLSDCYVTATTW